MIPSPAAAMLATLVLQLYLQALAGLESMSGPESFNLLPHQWDAAGDWRARASDASGGDSRQPRSLEPQWQFDADREAAEAAGAV